MRVLVIGYGSIGVRHVEILKEMGFEVSVLTKQKGLRERTFHSLKEALTFNSPDYVIIANKTCEHYFTLNSLAELGFEGDVLVEKPLFHETCVLPQHKFKGVWIGYNLRFHPLIQKLRRIIEKEPAISVQVIAGQYLPHWRPATDYRLSYSAHRKEGGGVLRDLSHELDYVTWLFGPWTRVTALGGRFSSLEIDSDDVFSIMMSGDNCPIVNIQINYLERVPRRELLINTANNSIKLDLIKGAFQLNGDEEEQVKLACNDTYCAQHEAIMNQSIDSLCSLEEGINQVRLIDLVEQAVENKEWVIP
jgi:predicted dehydrogenase